MRRHPWLFIDALSLALLLLCTAPLHGAVIDDFENGEPVAITSIDEIVYDIIPSVLSGRRELAAWGNATLTFGGPTAANDSIVIRGSQGDGFTSGTAYYGDSHFDPLNLDLPAAGLGFYIKLSQDPGQSVGWQVGLNSNGHSIGIGSANRRLNGSKYYELPFTAFPQVSGGFRLDDVDRILLQFDFYGSAMTNVAVTEFGIVPLPLAADFDGNKVVNAADLSLMRSNFGRKTATRAQGDSDGDADVDGADFLAWQRQLGLSSSTTVATVPEPNANAVALAAAAAIQWVKRRRGRS